MKCVIKSVCLCLALLLAAPIVCQEHFYLPTPKKREKKDKKTDASQAAPANDSTANNADELDKSDRADSNSTGQAADTNTPVTPVAGSTLLNLLATFCDANMIGLAYGGDEYIIGQDSQTYTAHRTITPFAISKYETTYYLWYNVRMASLKLGYVFANPGQEGTTGRRGKSPTASGQHKPVTMISWYDAIVWCNALSELEQLTPCYTYNGKVLRDSTDTAPCDLAACDWSASGYRLPTEAEWEYAARFTPQGLQRGDVASGAKGADEDAAAWSAANSREIHTVGTAGTVFIVPTDGQNAGDIMLPDPGSGNANGAGLFDMSGNVTEYCWDWFDTYTESTGRATGPAYGDERVSRGGSISPYTVFISSGDRYAFDPNEFYNYMGFRIAQSR